MSYFWCGETLEDFLFKGLNTHSWQGLLGLCVGLVSIAVLYEGLHVLKSFLLARFIQTRKARASSRASSVSSTPRDNNGGRPRSLLEETQSDEPLGHVHNASSTESPYSGFLDLSISSALHAVYITLGFTLMNAVMTFNVWVTAAICLGVGIGYFFFGNYRRTDALIVPLSPQTSRVPSQNSVASVGRRGGREASSSGSQRKTFIRREPNLPPGGGGRGDAEEEEEEHSKLIVGAQVHSPRVLPSTSS